MSHKSWKTKLSQIIRASKRLAIVGIGHELRGDDAVGIEIAHELQGQLPQSERVLICAAGAAPENVMGVLCRATPDCVLLIDAVQMNARPGTVRLLDVCDTASHPASTHTLPLTLFAQYLQQAFTCRVMLLGIQPESLAFGECLSPAIRHTKTAVVRAIEVALRQYTYRYPAGYTATWGTNLLAGFIILIWIVKFITYPLLHLSLWKP